MSINVVYAIVKAGGRQEKVSVGDVVVVDKLSGEIGDEVALAPLMLVDGDTVTTAPADLAKASVTAEIVVPPGGAKGVIIAIEIKIKAEIKILIIKTFVIKIKLIISTITKVLLR